MPKIPRLRWWIAGLLFLASILNYLDRQTLSILAPTIQKDLRIDDGDYANIVNAFLCAYTVSYLLSGRITDWIGARAGMAIFIAWWSVANMLTFFSRSFASLSLFRFLLGLGEAGGYTIAPKAASEWFTPEERGMVLGLVTLGATLGATLAPLLIVALVGHYGWRLTFVVTGAAGLVWIVPWLCVYRRPQAPAAIARRDTSDDQVFDVDSSDRPAAWSWRTIAGSRAVWALMLARTLTDPIWYFYQFWFSKYLFAERGISQKGLAITWVVFAAADLGTLAGGWGSGWLIRRGVSPVGSRIKIMAVCACLVPLSSLVPWAAPFGIAIAVSTVVVFAHMSWLINLSTLVVDLIPQGSIGTVFGVVATGSSLGAMAMNKFVGYLVTHYSYTPWFIVTFFLHPTAWLLLWRWVGRSSALSVPASSAIASAES